MTPPSRPAPRLLIVDDDAHLRQSLARRFQSQGMSVTEAGAGEEALAKAAQGRRDVGPLDLHLPGMSRTGRPAHHRAPPPAHEAPRAHPPLTPHPSPLAP